MLGGQTALRNLWAVMDKITGYCVLAMQLGRGADEMTAAVSAYRPVEQTPGLPAEREGEGALLSPLLSSPTYIRTKCLCTAARCW